MQIKRIFANKDRCKLWAVRYPEDGDIDIFRKLFEQWTDTEYLRIFFTSNQSKLQTDFWNYMAVSDAIDQVFDEAYDFETELRGIELGLPGFEDGDLGLIFEQLHESVYQLKSPNLDKRKAKPNFEKPMLRIYAVQLEDCYIVTGGAIKLTANMDKDEFAEEFKRLDTLSQYLKDNGIVSAEGFDQ